MDYSSGKRVTFSHFTYRDPDKANDPDAFAIAIYNTKKPIVDQNGRKMYSMMVKGNGLPSSPSLEYELFGTWEMWNNKPQFKLDTYRVIVPETRDGIVAFLSSNQIKGVGTTLANRIYDTFGNNTMNILDNDPDQLLTVSGISPRKLKTIKASYLESRAAWDIIAYLKPHGISVNQCLHIYHKYRKDAMNVVTHHPYQLCEIPGFSFKKADSIALATGLHPASEARIAAAILETMREPEKSGSLCLPKINLVEKSLALLKSNPNAIKLLESANIPVDEVLNKNVVAAEAAILREQGKLVTRGYECYRPAVAKAESDIANIIADRVMLMMNGTIPTVCNLTKELEQEDEKLGYKLDLMQRTAVGMAMSMYMCCITGGPGTGKTTIERAILDIYTRLHPDNKVCCCAPTGRAARRMAESTGYPARTIHSLLRINPEDATDDDDDEVFIGSLLDTDLVIVDEFSMVDIWVARALFNALPSRAQIILIGDADQLPSVGPGAVLSEILSCNSDLPIVRLDTVHRQAEGSTIARNAALIREGKAKLLYDEGFQFIESANMADSARLCCDIYVHEVQKYGTEQVCLLTPRRKETETSAAALNRELRDLINPAAPDKVEITYGKGKDQKTYRVGDRVMQLRNVEDLANGDCGYITSIGSNSDGDSIVTVDFGDGRTEELDQSTLYLIEWAYAMTIHKSQGSEYQSVILNLQNLHGRMLKRPLIYTAITRAKQNVYIVGDAEAIERAIKSLETERRETMLAERIEECVQERLRRVQEQEVYSR